MVKDVLSSRAPVEVGRLVGPGLWARDRPSEKGYSSEGLNNETGAP
jgi:hypothetical protein